MSGSEPNVGAGRSVLLVCHTGRAEAVTAALSWAGGEWGARVLAAGHFADNAASSRVLIKAGFLYTGEVVRRFSLARNEEAETRMAVWLA